MDLDYVSVAKELLDRFGLLFVGTAVGLAFLVRYVGLPKFSIRRPNLSFRFVLGLVILFFGSSCFVGILYFPEEFTLAEKAIYLFLSVVEIFFGAFFMREEW